MATSNKRGGRKSAAKKAVPIKKSSAIKKRASRSAAKKPAAKKSAARKPTPAKRIVAAKPKVKRTPNAAFMKAMMPSETLARIVGASPIPRTEVVRKMWQYIKQNGLQDAINKRMINADENLQRLFGKTQVSMFEMSKYINQHLK